VAKAFYASAFRRFALNLFLHPSAFILK